MKKSILYFSMLILLSCSTKRQIQNTSSFHEYKYQLNINEFENDKLNVILSIDNLDKENARYCFPKIVPGIYGAMDFGQYISSIQFLDKKGNKLVSKKIDVNCWEIKNAKNITEIRYEVDDTWENFDFEMQEGFYKSAASTFKEDVFILNPNCLFGYFRELDNFPIEVIINKPSKFYGATSLNRMECSPTQDKFKADNYQQLVDNPIMYSAPDTSTIKLPNIEVEVACYSSSNRSLSREIANYIKPLIINQTEYLGGKLPVEKYTFILYHNLNPDQNSYLGDGLEHSNSTLILFYMPLDLEIIKENVYGIASHEFFHTLMPLGIHSHEIANYDFNEPKFSRHLWLYEGMTEYFTIHMPIKNGLQEVPEFLEVLTGILTAMKEFNNQLSFTELSLNAMEFQDQYYNVYLKGTMINLCLDIQLRELSKGKYGVQDLVFDLMEKYGVNKSFEDEKLFTEITGITGFNELNDFFKKYVTGSENLPLEEMLSKVGLAIEDEKIVEVKDLTNSQKELRGHWLGVHSN